MKELLESFSNHIGKLGGNNIKLIFEPPANIEEIDEVEKNSAMSYPMILRMYY